MIEAIQLDCDLGMYSRRIDTLCEDAQTWFNRGLIWTYGFNHEEAGRCFSRALTYDSGCCMACWGLAYALGPNYNKPWEFYSTSEMAETLEVVCKAARDAQRLSSSSPPVEKALIQALQSRYPKDTSRGDWSRWNADFAEAMRPVYEAFPDDLDVVAIYVDALMNLTPWKLWDINTGQPAVRAQTTTVQHVLDRALLLPGAFQHPGLLHLYIHFIEMSPRPEDGIDAANALRGLVPDAGHLQHMPTHIDVLCGDYQRAISSNQEAVIADEKFFASRRSNQFYTLYPCHNFHFRVYAAMLCGQSQVALQSVAGAEAALTEELLRVETPPMADWLEGFLTLRVHVLVRFGRWRDLLLLPFPIDDRLYCVTTAMLRYGRALAYASLNSIRDAEKEQAFFIAALQRVPSSRMLFNNTCCNILRVAEAMLEGEIEYRRNNFDIAFQWLEEAIRRDDSLEYDEPWGWMQPTRHAYGALLLEQDRVQEAYAVYRADLGLDDTLPRALQHRNNVWALHGYHECLIRLGRSNDARDVAPQVTKALALADVPVNASCFCRLSSV